MIARSSERLEVGLVEAKQRMSGWVKGLVSEDIDGKVEKDCVTNQL